MKTKLLKQDSIDRTLGCIVIGEPGAYKLVENITTAGPGIVIATSNVTLDLAGCKIHHADSVFVEAGSWWFDGIVTRPCFPPTGWPTTKMPLGANWDAGAAAITMKSEPIPIRVPNSRHAATLLVKGENCSVTIKVRNASQNELGSAKIDDTENGVSPVVLFVPGKTESVSMEVTIEPKPGKAGRVVIGYPEVYKAFDYGIIAAPGYYLPPQLAALKNIPAVRNVSISGGFLYGDVGYGNSAIYCPASDNVTIDGLHATGYGIDLMMVYAMYATNLVIQNCQFYDKSHWVTRRTSINSTIYVAKGGGDVTITDCHIEGQPQCGISVQENKSGHIVIRDNFVKGEAKVSNPYGIYLSGVQQFEVIDNNVMSENGRGISLDSTSDIPTNNGVIAGNYVSVKQLPNLEYPASAMAATAMRIRNWGTPQRNLDISRNTLIASTGPGMVDEAIGLRVTQSNVKGQSLDSGNVISRNTIRATTTDPAKRAAAVSISGVDDGTGLRFEANRLESNDMCLRFGDRDCWQKTNAGIDFVLTEFVKLPNEPKDLKHASVEAGASETNAENIRLSGSKYANGATSDIRFVGPGRKKIELGAIEIRPETSISQTGSNPPVTAKV